MFTTEQMRTREGQYSHASDDYMVAAGVERKSVCEACGHAIELHVGVVSPTGRAMWVGINCAATLTSGEQPASVVTPQGKRDYVQVSAEWLRTLRAAAYLPDSGRGLIVRNQFLASVYRQVSSRGRASVKQFDAVNKAMD